jgi:hypothetical protein
LLTHLQFAAEKFTNMKLYLPTLFFASIIATSMLLLGLSPVYAQYSFQTLAILDSSGSYGQSINDSGEIAGYYTGATGYEGFIRDSMGNVTTLNVPGAAWTQAYGINNSGEVVGLYNSGATNAVNQSFLYDDGNYTTIDVPGSSYTYAYSINNNGEISGEADLSSGVVGFVDNNGTYTTTSLSYSGMAFGNGINNSGDVAGSFENGPAFIVNGSTYTYIDIPTSNGSDDFAQGINDDGDVVLWDADDDSIWVDNNGSFVLMNLNEPNGAIGYGINNSGVVVGNFNNGNGAEYTFIATPSGSSTVPTISSFTPNSGPVGTTITITGTQFTGVNAIYFSGGVSATPTDVTATSATVVVPSGAVTGTIAAATSTGAGTSAKSLTVIPAITSFSPASGPVETYVTVNGSGLTGATAVSIDGYPASFSFVDDSEIQFTVPAQAKTGVIHVKTAGGLAASATNFIVVGIPTITSFTPTSGAVGSTVTVTGSGFTGTTAVSVDGYPATFTFVNNSQLTFVVPKGASTGAIHVKNAQGLGASTTDFTVVGIPDITGFTPANGPVGTTVTVTGSSFTGTTAVSVDGYPAIFTFVNDGQLTFTVPKGASTGAIHVKNAQGLGASATNFIVVGIPVITSFTPTSGPVGTVVTVQGSSFTGTTAVSIDGYPASFTFDSDTQLTFTVPKGAGTGAIHVKNAQGLGASATSFTVN